MTDWRRDLGAGGWARLRRRGGGFTLVEIIVVVVIVSILASVMIPRLLNTAERRAGVEAEAVRQLMTAVARRAATGGDTLAIVYDGEARELRVEERRAQPKEGPDGKPLGNPEDAGTPTWVRSRLVPAVRLEQSLVARALLDGREGPAGGSWRLELPRGFPRPTVSLLLAREEEGASAFQVDAGPDRTSAAVTALGNIGLWRPLASRAVDLDATGRRTATW